MASFIYKNKKVFYKIKGKGQPLLLLHGNTMSSKMFTTLAGLYAKHYKIILTDFPGHGRSEREKNFETDFWYYNAQTCKALLDHLQLRKVAIIGTSGGALVAINLCLEYPERINYLVADSFEGAYPLKSYVKNIEKNRKQDKKKILAKLIWFYMHGFNWKKVVDADTKVNIDFFHLNKSFFHKPISELKVSTLLTGSREDEYCNYLESIYKNLASKNQNLSIYMFNNGNHPAMISNKKEFFSLVKKLI